MEISKLGIVTIYDAGIEGYRHIDPSVKVAGTWQDTDVSSEDSEVQSLCTTTWTDEIKTAYQSHIDTNLVEG